MRRRDFVKGIACATAWPLAARAQTERARLIGILSNKRRDDPEGQNELSVLVAALNAHGWTLGRNLKIESRWGAGSGELYRTYAAELVKLAPDVLLASGGTVTGALQRATHEIPIVFVETTDPVDRGLVASLSKPGSNTTGFTQFDFAITGKWLELLKEIAPDVTRAAVIRDPDQFSGVAELAAIQAIAASRAVDISSIDARYWQDRNRTRTVCEPALRRTDRDAERNFAQKSRPDHRFGGGAPCARYLCQLVFHRCGRLDLLWVGHP
jgi:putative tryptophan/tyrosine transport system substrate-binding protein